MEAWVKRVKHVRNEEEAPESASNDAVISSLGQSVGGDARVGAASESDSLEQKRRK